MKDNMLLIDRLAFALGYCIDSTRNLSQPIIKLIQEKNRVLGHQTSNWSLRATKVFSPIPDTCFSSSMDLN